MFWSSFNTLTEEEFGFFGVPNISSKGMTTIASVGLVYLPTFGNVGKYTTHGCYGFRGFWKPRVIDLLL